jgi:hypothetical protein
VIVCLHGLDPGLHLRKALAHLVSVAAAVGAAVSVPEVVAGLDRNAEVGSDFAEDRFQAGVGVRCLTHAKQVRKRPRTIPRGTRPHLLLIQKKSGAA